MTHDIEEALLVAIEQWYDLLKCVIERCGVLGPVIA